MPTVTYLILAHGEEQVFSLINFISLHKQTNDKIMILNDPTTDEFLSKLKKYPVKVINHKLEQDYSAHRNQALQYIKTDYIFALDADEVPNIKLMQDIPKIIENKVDMVWIPRLNLFKGVKPIDALQCGWTLNGEVVNFPDPQTRLFRNRRGIRWVGKLHERLKVDSKIHKVMELPMEQDYSIIHLKTIEKQIQDNINYMTKYSIEDNQGKATDALL